MTGNHIFFVRPIAAGTPAWRRQLHRGFVDAQNRPRHWPRDDYETMSTSEQIAYECGRLLVREAIAEGFALPVWRGDKAGCGPVDRLHSSVCQALGRDRIMP
jgi:hypothetical protein